MRNSLRSILILAILLAVAIGGPPTVNLSNFQQYSYPGFTIKNTYYGNVSTPSWSSNDEYIAVTLYNPDEKIRHIVIYDLKNDGTPFRINTAMAEASRGRKISYNDTYHPIWSPIKEMELFVISRIKRNDYLHKISLTNSNRGLKIERVDRKYESSTPVLNYSISNKSDNYAWGLDDSYLILHSGTKDNLNMALYNVDDVGQKSPPTINSADLSEFESDSYANSDGWLKIIMQGYDQNQSDLFFMEGKINDIGELKNLTNSLHYNERLGKFSTDGRYVAYLRSKNIPAEKADDNILIHSLCVYDLENNVGKELDNSVFVIPDIFYLSAFTWLDENTLIYIDDDFDAKYPLYAVNITTGEKQSIKSPLINHKEIAVSTSGRKLGIIARGKDENPDMSFDKLYICDIDW